MFDARKPSIIDIRRADSVWVATFSNVPSMPEGVELPLAYTDAALLQVVSADLRKRFPRATIATTRHCFHVNDARD